MPSIISSHNPDARQAPETEYKKLHYLYQTAMSTKRKPKYSRRYYITIELFPVLYFKWFVNRSAHASVLKTLRSEPLELTPLIILAL